MMLRSSLLSAYLRRPLAASELRSALLLPLQPINGCSGASVAGSFSYNGSLCPSSYLFSSRSICCSSRSFCSNRSFCSSSHSLCSSCHSLCSSSHNLCCSNRSLCSSSRHRAPLAEVSRQVLQVRPYYGLLCLKGNLKFIIKPDIEHQCGSVCTVRLLAPLGSSASLEFEQSHDLAQLDILAHSGEDLLQRGDHEEEPHCEVNIPIKYDLSAFLSGSAGLEVLELQNDSTTVSTETGSCTVHKLQALNMDYRTDSGPLLVRRKLLASLSARGRQLSITGDAVQAGSVALSGEAVHCSLQSVHANTLSVQAATATLTIKDITAASTLNIDNAIIDIGNCSGALAWQLNEASVTVAVPQLLEDSLIDINSGRCSVACPAEYRYGIQVRGERVTVRPGFDEFVHGRGESDDLQQGGGEGIQREGKPLQEARVSAPGPLLRVVVRHGSVALVPWTWPLSNH